MAETLGLSRITTKDHDGNANGWMIPIYKKDDPFFSGYDMRFVYASAISRCQSKGPHLHKKRECRLVCIQGDVQIIVRENGEYQEYSLSGHDPKMLVIKAGDPFMISTRIMANEDAIILNFANHIWRSDDQDNYKPDDWDYNTEGRLP